MTTSMMAPSTRRLALVTVVTASAAIVYELLIGTLSTYLQGDSALQYSITIGVFLAAMGVGAWLARGVEQRRDLVGLLIRIEVAVSLLGGFSALALYAANAVIPAGYTVSMVGLLAALGTLVGMELPVLAELFKRQGGVRGAFASALALDYAGSLVGSLAFPLLLLPTLGTVKTALVTGAINLSVVALLIRVSRPAGATRLWALLVAALALLLTGAVKAERMVAWFEHRIYRDEVIWSDTTRFQRIVMTRHQDDLRLYSDRELQFSSRDEYRYHEALVHPALALTDYPEQVLLVGGGDGLAARELLKDGRLRALTIVDIDPAMTGLGAKLPQLRALNRDSLSDPRVSIVNADGYRFALGTPQRFDVIVLDLPDPRTEAIARLYAREFYRLLLTRLNPGGTLVTQASSPYYARDTFWSIDATLRSLALHTRPYRINVPAFGEWGFVVAQRERFDWRELRLELPRRWLTHTLLQQAVTFDTDTARPAHTPISTLESPAAWRLYRRHVSYWR